MLRFNLILVVGIILLSCVCLSAQSGLVDEFRTIRPIRSSRTEVEKVFGMGKKEDDSTWYYLKDKSIEAVYSDGNCTNGWLAQKDRVIEISAFFLEYRDLSELRAKVDLEKLRKETSFDVLGEASYFDDTAGIKYSVNVREGTWMSITYYPPKKYLRFRCKE